MTLAAGPIMRDHDTRKQGAHGEAPADGDSEAEARLRLARAYRARQRRATAESGGGQRAPAPAPHEKLDGEDFRYFFETVYNIGVACHNGQGFAFENQDKHELNDLEIKLITIVDLCYTDEPDKRAKAVTMWSDAKKALYAMAPCADKAGTSPRAWDEARIGMEQIESRVVAQNVAEQTRAVAAGERELTGPGQAFAEKAVKEAPKSLEASLELMAKTYEGVEAVGSVALKGFKKELLATHIGTAKLALGLLKDGADIREKLEKFRKAGLVDQAATVIDLANFLAKTMQEEIELTTTAIKIVGYARMGEKAEEALEKLPLLDKLEGVKDALGKITLVYDSASAALALVSAIIKGDSEGIVKASFGVAQAGWNIAAQVGKVGSIGTVAVGFYIYEVGAMVLALGRLGGTIKAMRQDAKIGKISNIVEQSQTVVANARMMAAAADLQAEQAGADLDAGVRDRLMQQYGDQAQQYAAATMGGLRSVRRLVDHLTSGAGRYADLAQSLRPEHQRALDRIDDPAFADDGALSPYGVLELCKGSFGAVDDMVRQVSGEDEYGEARKAEDGEGE